MQPKISIITPSFNQGKFIEETIHSVLNQNYSNLEYIIIDGGSNDNSIDVIKKYEFKIKYWISEPDNGQSHAINKGLKQATGDIINWINSDDLLAPNSLSRIAEIYAKKPEIKCLIGNYYIKSKNKTEEITDKVLKNTFYDSVRYPIIKQPSTFYSRIALEKMGTLNESLHYTMDYDWYIKFLINFGVTDVYETTDFFSTFRLHDDSKTSKNSELFEQEIFQLQEDLLTQLSSMGDSEEKTRTGQIVALYYFNRALEAYQQNRFQDFRELKNKIPIQYLQKADAVLLKKALNRSKFLPDTLLKTMKQVKRIIN
jgi:glycosyltransferase involved in cell wall biosynthesis